MKKLTTAFIAVTLVVVIALAAFIALNIQPPNNPTDETQPTNYTYTVINTYPHDTNAFTEGLAYSNGYLYESTGLNGNSNLRKEDLQTGEVLQETALDSQYFGEGITIFGDKIIQLTWQSHIAFIYNENTFQLLGSFTYPTEGWGITNDGTNLIMSDGTPTLYFLNPQTYERTATINVHDGNESINNLNELEYINGTIYANVWQTNRIAIINIQTGQVTGWVNLEGLNKNPVIDPYNDVLNGIAYDSGGSRLFVTGKRWSQLFEIKISPRS